MSPVKNETMPIPSLGVLKGNNMYKQTGSQQDSLSSLGLNTRMATGTITDVFLKEAAEQAVKEGNERPLMLEQLRTKIKLQRLRDGKRELPPVTFEEPKKYELTEEEKIKQDRRKKRNREAAKKSRLNKKNRHSELQKNNKTLKEKNRRLRSQVNSLYDLTATFQNCIRQLRRCSFSRPPPSPSLQILPGPSTPGPMRQASRESISQKATVSLPLRGMSGRFSPAGQQFFISDNNTVPINSLVDAGSSSRFSSTVSSRHAVRIPARQDTASCTITRSSSESSEVMEVEDSPSCQIITPPENGPSFVQSVQNIPSKEAGDYSPGVDPQFSPQDVDHPMPTGLTFLQMLEEAETLEVPGEMRTIFMENAVYNPSRFLGAASSGDSPKGILPSPDSPPSPDNILRFPRGH